MRLLLNRIDAKTHAGFVKVLPENSEDLWHAYNLIVQGDKVTATTFRKVVRESSSTGSTAADRRRMTLTVLVHRCRFDQEATSCTLRVTGGNLTASDHSGVKLGAFHALELEPLRAFSLEKDEWDSVSLQRIKEACDPVRGADVGAVVVSESGSASICLLGPSVTSVRTRVECPVPRKGRQPGGLHEKTMAKFFEQTLQATIRHIDLDAVKCLIIAGPGFSADVFWAYVLDQAHKRGASEPSLGKFLLHKAKIMRAKCGSAHVSSLQEALQDPAVANALSDTKATGEVQALKMFYDAMRKDSAVYGVKHVQKAQEMGAIDTLLLSDALFRSPSVELRKSFVGLVEAVKNGGGTVHIFSSLHSSGQQLAQLTGAAAILRFPMPGLDDEIEEEIAAMQEEGAPEEEEEEASFAEYSVSAAGVVAASSSSSSAAAAASLDEEGSDHDDPVYYEEVIDDDN